MNEIIINDNKSDFLKNLMQVGLEEKIPIIIKDNQDLFHEYILNSYQNIIIFNLEHDYEKTIAFIEENKKKLASHKIAILVKDLAIIPEDLLLIANSILIFDIPKNLLKIQLINLREQNTLTRSLIEYKNLYEASKIINSTLNIERALQLILEIIAKLLQA